MDIGELWDTIVLRDILGYIVPGALLLLGLRVLVTGLGLTEWAPLISAVLPTDPWLLRAAFLVLSYAMGHLLGWAARGLFQAVVPCWRDGRITLELLNTDALGDQYRKAALQMVAAEQRAAFRRGLLTASTAEDRAEHLRKLCDLYVWHAAPQLHRSHVGRFSVLSVFFRNLGISTVSLGLCGLTLVCPSGQDALAQILQGTSSQIQFIHIVIGVVVLISLGLGFIYRAVSVRRRFVHRAFELLYVLTVRERWSLRQPGA